MHSAGHSNGAGRCECLKMLSLSLLARGLSNVIFLILAASIQSITLKLVLFAGINFSNLRK